MRCVCRIYNSTKWNHFTNIKFNYVRFLEWQCVFAYLFIAPVPSLRHGLNFENSFGFVIQLWAAYIAWAWAWALLLNLYLKLSMLRPIWWTLNEKLALIERREHTKYRMQYFLCVKIPSFLCNGCYRWIFFIWPFAYIYL